VAYGSLCGWFNGLRLLQINYCYKVVLVSDEDTDGWIKDVCRVVGGERYIINDCVPFEVRRIDEDFRDYLNRVWDGDIYNYLREHKKVIREAWEQQNEVDSRVKAGG